MEPEDIIELRFFGEGIKPETVRVSELAELMLSFESSLLATAADANPGVDIQDAFISLIDIRHTSEGLRFAPSLKEVIVPAFLTIASALSTNNLDQLPKKVLDRLAPIQRFMEARNCGAEFKLDDQVLATISPGDEALRRNEANKRSFVQGETTLYASVLRAGGRTPRVALKIRGVDSLFFLDVSELIARKLAARLYDTVGLLVNAKWEMGSYRLVDFKIKELLAFESVNTAQGFDALRDTIGKYWDEVEDIDEMLHREPFMNDQVWNDL